MIQEIILLHLELYNLIYISRNVQIRTTTDIVYFPYENLKEKKIYPLGFLKECKKIFSVKESF